MDWIILLRGKNMQRILWSLRLKWLKNIIGK
jgi:hypothetical protein